MALYLVVHSPRHEERASVQEPTRLVAMARDALVPASLPKWISTYSPDLHDDRIFSMWEANEGAQILEALERYGFLTDMEAHPIRVQRWGPADVLATEHEATD